MDDDLVLQTYLLVHEKLSDICSLVARQLQNLAQLCVLRHAAVALECLLEGLGYPCDVEVRREAWLRSDADGNGEE